jgi:hypothetical protein
MSRVIKVQGQVSFTPICLVCFLPAQKHYTVERTFSYGREAIDAHVDVPLCDTHYAVAVRKSRTEEMVGRAGFWVGIILGAVVGLGLVINWAGSGQGSLIPNIFLGLAVGGSFFVVFWSATLFWLAPRFADQESLRVRETVRILRYWPGDQLMELEINNDRASDLIQPVLGIEE